MEFSRQEYWSGVPFPPLVDLPNTGIEACLKPPALAGWLFTTSATWEAFIVCIACLFQNVLRVRITQDGAH